MCRGELSILLGAEEPLSETERPLGTGNWELGTGSLRRNALGALTRPWTSCPPTHRVISGGAGFLPVGQDASRCKPVSCGNGDGRCRSDGLIDLD